MLFLQGESNSVRFDNDFFSFGNLLHQNNCYFLFFLTIIYDYFKSRLSCRRTGLVALQLTYVQTSTNLLPITVIGSELTCAGDGEMLVTTEIEALPCQHNHHCDFIEETLVSGMSHCTYECRCDNKIPCLILMYARYRSTKSLCDVFRTDTFILV